LYGPTKSRPKVNGFSSAFLVQPKVNDNRSTKESRRILGNMTFLLCKLLKSLNYKIIFLLDLSGKELCRCEEYKAITFDDQAFKEVTA